MTEPTEFCLHDNGTPGGQRSFLDDQTHNLAAITGRGGGKTFIGALKTAKRACDCEGSNILITAPTYSMLRESTKPAFMALIPPELIRWNKENINEMMLENNTHLYFRSTHEPNHLRGFNLSFWWGDEAACTPYEAYLIIAGAMREAGFPLQMTITSTPKGAQQWIFDLFGPENTVRDPEHFRLYNWTTFDNPNLPQEYIDNLGRLYVGNFAKQELYGEFIENLGLVYAGFFYRKNNVKQLFFNDKWPVILGWDFGFNDPTAVLAFQQDPYGRLFQIDEIYTVKMLDEDIVTELKSRPYFHYVRDVVCDSSAPQSIHRLRQLGLPARPCKHEGGGKDDINVGIQKVASLLKVDPILGTPRLIINDTCESTVSEFNLYSYPERLDDGSIRRNTNQKPLDAYNHAMDVIRYVVTTCVSPLISVEYGSRPRIVRRKTKLDHLFNNRRIG